MRSTRLGILLVRHDLGELTPDEVIELHELLFAGLRP